MSQWKFIGGKIWQNGHLINNAGFSISVTNETSKVIELDNEDILIPGYYDLHCHVWGQKNAYGVGSVISISPDHLLSTGIVACADAGSYGYNDWEEANRIWTYSPITIKSWLNVIPESLTTPGIPYTTADQVNKERLISLFERNRASLIGYKFMHGLMPTSDQEHEYLALAREVADATGGRIMIHLTGSKIPIQETIGYLKPGDILSHVFNYGKPFGVIIDENGEIIPEVIEAQKRGILLESSSAFRHFSFQSFEAARDAGINADIIATDNNLRDFRRQPLFDITHFMSKMVADGMNIEKALKAAIDTPCEIMGLNISYDKNVVLLRHITGDFDYQDTTLKDPAPIVIHRHFSYQIEYGIYNNWCVFSRNNNL